MQISATKKLSVSCGSSLDQGKRDYMEDRLSIIENLLDNESAQQIKYFAIFDGHAGSRAADIAQGNLHNMVKEHPDVESGDLKEILKVSAFVWQFLLVITPCRMC